jgi:transposase
MLKYSVGLDVSSKDIHACISAIDAEQKVKVISSKVINNTPKGFEILITWIEKNRKQKDLPVVIGMEATGIYHEECAYYLYDKKYSVCIVLPNYAKKFLQASGLKSKNDKIDAKGLAQMFAERAFALWAPMDKFYYHLRALTRQQESLQEIKTGVVNQHSAAKRSAFINKEVIKQLNETIKFLEKKIAEIEKKIITHLKSNKEIEDQVQNVLTVTGIGIVTLAILLAETNGFLLFKSTRQLVSFSGYDVVENQSGRHRGKTKISKKGNSHIRRSLFFPAFTAVSHKCKPFLDLYNRTFEKHKIKMKSYVAVQKKLLVIVYTIWKKNVRFTEQYITDNTREKELESTSLDSLVQAE